MGKHTPGPWVAKLARWTPESELFGFAIEAPGRIRPLASAGVSESKSLIISKEYANIAPGYFSPDEVEANARLIAAAPALLAACEAIWNAWKEDPQVLDPDWDGYATMQKVKEAIAQAESEVADA